MSRTMLVLICLLGLCIAAHAQSLEELEVDHALTFQFPTPHTDWAQPYALGKARVLFFTNGHNTAPRECVELMQRFDLEAQAVFYATIVDSPKTQWHGGAVGERRMSALLDKRWDCFVLMGGVGTDKFGAEPLYKLLRQVVGGAGLVMVGTDDPRILKEGNQAKALPPFLSSEPVAAAFTIGQGRGLRLPPRPDIGYYEGWQVDYDYWAERLGRAVLWAAGKEPTADLSVVLEQQEFELGGVCPAFTWTVSDSADLSGVRAERRFRRAGRPSVFETVARSVASGEAYSESLRAWWGAGDYHVDLRLVGPKGTVAWATAPYKVTSPLKISALTLGRDWGEVGDHLEGSVALDGSPDPGDQLRVTIKDRRGRQLQRQTMPATSARKSFDFAIEPWMPMLVTVEAMLYDPDGPVNEITSAYTYFRVTKRNRDRWNFLIWDIPKGTLAPYGEESLARAGMTLQLTQGNPPPIAAAFETAWVPYTTRILSQSKDANGIMRPFCWNDEAAVQAEVTALAQAHVPSRQHGVFVYSLGDENDTLGACLSPHCATAYRQYLRQEYASLDALNASWGTAFTSWDEVGLSKADDNEEAEALRANNYPRWFDRQAFKSYNYVQYCQKYAAAYRTIDPQSRTGFEGAGTFAGGDDLDLIARTLEFWSPYPGTADEVLRSLAPQGFPHANWMGYTKDASSLLGQFWRMVTRGMDAVWWWRWDCIGAFHGWLAPDMRPYPAVQEILKDTQIVRDGLGDLLQRSTMQDDGIAVLYSYPSVFAHKLGDGGSFGAFENAHLAAHSMIRELGLQFRYVTDRQMRRGEFDPKRWKALFLPRVEALGDKEAAAIRRYVEQGGTVIADVRVGLYDEHCKPRGRGVLDDLFGVTREGSAPAKLAAASLPGKTPLSFEKALADPAVRLANGKAAGEAEGAPIGIIRQVGKGRAILLNLAFASFPRLGVSDTPEAAAQVVRGWLSPAGITPALTLANAKGARARGVEVIRWRNSGTEIMALFRQGGVATAEAVRVKLPRGAFVYDLRNRRSLGKQAAFTTSLMPNRASFFVMSSRPAPVPVIKWQRGAVARGEVARATISVPGAQGLHALRLRAKCGDRNLEWLSQNLLVGAQAKTVDLPVALNDPQGTYEVSAIDLFTNQPTTAKLVVR